MRMAEENWSIELTALGIRNRALEGDVGQLKEETRRQKIAYSKIASHAAYLEATTDTAEMSGKSKFVLGLGLGLAISLYWWCLVL